MAGTDSPTATEPTDNGDSSAEPQVPESAKRYLLILKIFLCALAIGLTGYGLLSWWHSHYIQSTAYYLRLARSDEWVDRWRALGVLPSRLDEEGVAEAVSDGLSDESPIIRTNTALLLAQLGPRAKVIAPALIRATRDPDRNMRAAAIEALGEIKDGRPGVVEALLAAVRDEQMEMVADYALGQILRANPSAVARLEAAVAAMPENAAPELRQAIRETRGATASPQSQPVAGERPSNL